MKLRIARKIDQTPPHVAPNRRRDKRVWWQVYNVDQLRAAERRLRRSWRRLAPMFVHDDGRRGRKTTPDFFAANRVKSRRQRQAAIMEYRRVTRTD